MKALTLSEAARRNFFEIQNSSSELKVYLEVVDGSGTFEVSILKGMSLYFFSPNADRISTHGFIMTEEKALPLQFRLEVFLGNGYKPQALSHKLFCCFDKINTSQR